MRSQATALSSPECALESPLHFMPILERQLYRRPSIGGFFAQMLRPTAFAACPWGRFPFLTAAFRQKSERAGLYRVPPDGMICVDGETEREREERSGGTWRSLCFCPPESELKTWAKMLLHSVLE